MLVPPPSGLQTWGLMGWAVGVLWLPPMKVATPLVLHRSDVCASFPPLPGAEGSLDLDPSLG